MTIDSKSVTKGGWPDSTQRTIPKTVKSGNVARDECRPHLIADLFLNTSVSTVRKKATARVRVAAQKNSDWIGLKSSSPLPPKARDKADRQPGQGQPKTEKHQI